MFTQSDTFSLPISRHLGQPQADRGSQEGGAQDVTRSRLSGFACGRDDGPEERMTSSSKNH
jgi:hypothetical protein